MRVFKTILALSAMLSVSVTAAADMNIFVDSGIVTVNGTMPDAKGQYVNIIVQDKKGNLIYVGQEELDHNGDFEVQYQPPESEYGEHSVSVISNEAGDKTMTKGYYISGESDDSSQNTTPEVKPSTSGSNSGGGGGGGSKGGGGGAASSLLTPGSSDFVVLQLQTDAVPFIDIRNHWAQSEIEKAYAERWVDGISDTEFAPDNLISRAEIAALMVKRFNIKSRAYENKFSDISSTDWYEPYISVLCSKGIVNGYGDVFMPEKPVTRQEAAKMIMLASGTEPADMSEANNTFADDKEISDWARQYIYTAAKLGIIQGRDGNIFAPNGNATRAEVVVMLSRVK